MPPFLVLKMAPKPRRQFDLAAAAAQQAVAQAAEVSQAPHSHDVDRYEPPGRSWLWNHFHLRKAWTKEGKNTYYCNHCCAGRAGHVDSLDGKIELKNAALNPLERHLSKLHGVTKTSAAASPGQTLIRQHSKLPKAQNEKTPDAFAEDVLIEDSTQHFSGF